MPSTIPFKEMNRDLSLIAAKSQLLLGLPEVEFKESTYALFFILEGKRSIKHDSRRKMLIQIGVWIRFLKSIIEELPAGHKVIAEAQKDVESLEQKYPEVEKKTDVLNSDVG